MKRRIALSLFLLGCAFCESLGCVDTGAVADDQPADIAPDAAVANGIGTSPVSGADGSDADVDFWPFPGNPADPTQWTCTRYTTAVCCCLAGHCVCQSIEPGPTDTTGVAP